MTNARRPVGVRNSAPAAAPSLYSEVSSHSEGLNEGPHSERAVSAAVGPRRRRTPNTSSKNGNGVYEFRVPRPDSLFLALRLVLSPSELPRLSPIGSFWYVMGMASQCAWLIPLYETHSVARSRIVFNFTVNLK